MSDTWMPASSPKLVWKENRLSSLLSETIEINISIGDQSGFESNSFLGMKSGWMVWMVFKWCLVFNNQSQLKILPFKARLLKDMYFVNEGGIFITNVGKNSKSTFGTAIFFSKNWKFLGEFWRVLWEEINI